MLPEHRVTRLERDSNLLKRAFLFAATALVASSLLAADSPRMIAAIDGEAGQLAPAEVSEVWATGEVVITFLKPSDGAERVVLKGADTTLVADGYRFHSDRTWKVTGKRTYTTVGGVERSILVAELTNRSGTDGCAVRGRAEGWCYSNKAQSVHKGDVEAARIVQILNDKELLVTMRVLTGYPQRPSGNTVVLLRGVDTTKLTEDSPVPFRRPADEHEAALQAEGRCSYPITGTYKYKSTDGTLRTVFVADADKAGEDRIANQRRLAEDEQRKLEAGRKAEVERKAAEQAENERKVGAEKARWRTWGDTTGTFKIEAKYLGLAGDCVVLKKQDGKTIRVALDKLSTEDQEWVEQSSSKTIVATNLSEKSADHKNKSVNDVCAFFRKGIASEKPGTGRAPRAASPARSPSISPPAVARAGKTKHNRVYTVRELKAKFGEPDDRKADSGHEVWNYKCSDGIVEVRFVQLNNTSGHNLRLEIQSVDSKQYDH